ncbi:MAG: DMT family transporter [Candidatus Dormibacteria bacterium]
MSKRGWVLFGAMCILWGLPYLLIRVSVESVSPFVLVFGRTAIGAVILLPVAALRGQVGAVLTRWRPLLAFTVIEIAVPWVLLSEAETHISSSLSGLLVAAVPLAGTVMVTLAGRSEGLRKVQLTGLVVGLGGVVAVLGFDLRSLTLGAGLEMGMVVVCYALGPQILARRLSDLPGLGVVACSLGLCALAYLPAALLTVPRTPPPGTVLASILVLGVVCTAAAFILFFQLIAAIGAIRATVIAYVNPAVAVVLGVVVLHERFTPGIALGFGLILLGSLLANRARITGRPPDLPRPLLAES